MVGQHVKHEHASQTFIQPPSLSRRVQVLPYTVCPRVYQSSASSAQIGRATPVTISKTARNHGQVMNGNRPREFVTRTHAHEKKKKNTPSTAASRFDANTPRDNFLRIRCRWRPTRAVTRKRRGCISLGTPRHAVRRLHNHRGVRLKLT